MMKFLLLYITCSLWLLLLLLYGVCKWYQKPRSVYVIPRVFVLCSPRNVQFHYEILLRVGLPSFDFNPDKHDLDVTLLGQQNKEVVPLTRLSTRTLLDEPLITCLSIVAYRLVEMPQLGGLVLRHLGPFKASVYAYDLTVIDLTTNAELYYVINQYVGSVNKTVLLDEPNGAPAEYPVDDVPLPQWQLDDLFLLLFVVLNLLMLLAASMPLGCSHLDNVAAVVLSSLLGGGAAVFLDWLLCYCLRWNQARKDFFNNYAAWAPLNREGPVRALLALAGAALGGASVWRLWRLEGLQRALVWLLVVSNSATLLLGLWNFGRQIELGELLVAAGLRLRAVETVEIGVHYTELLQDAQSKSLSASDEHRSGLDQRAGSSILGMAMSSQLHSQSPQRRPKPRSSLKSFGFELVPGNRKRVVTSSGSRMSSTGATPNNQPASLLRLMAAVEQRQPARRLPAPERSKSKSKSKSEGRKNKK